MKNRGDYIRLAYQLMLQNAEFLECDNYVAMWAPDQIEPQNEICVYKLAAIEHDAGCSSIGIHLDTEVFREDADVVEHEVWEQEQVTPVLGDENSLLREFAD